MIKSDSLAQLAPALLKAQKKMGAALKDSKNPFFKSKYADLNAVIDASVPVLNEEGIAVLQSPSMSYDLSGNPIPVIETVLLHESGEYIAGQTEVVAAKQNDPQAAGSATTYARRYGLQAMVTLKAEDDDGEKAMAAVRNQPVQETKVVVTASQPVEQTTAPKPKPFTRTKPVAPKAVETDDGL
jgi:hypothetical protein